MLEQQKSKKTTSSKPTARGDYLNSAKKTTREISPLKLRHGVKN
jgi:hypothetical protein